MRECLGAAEIRRQKTRPLRGGFLHTHLTDNRMIAGEMPIWIASHNAVVMNEKNYYSPIWRFAGGLN